MVQSIDIVGGTPTLKEALKDQKYNTDYDCTPCRLMGSVVFTGLGIYTYSSGMSQLKQQQRAILKSGSRFGMGARKAAIVGTSATLVALGAYRMIN